MRRNIGNELIVALFAAITLVLAAVFAILLATSTQNPPRPTAVLTVAATPVETLQASATAFISTLTTDIAIVSDTPSVTASESAIAADETESPSGAVTAAATNTELPSATTVTDETAVPVATSELGATLPTVPAPAASPEAAETSEDLATVYSPTSITLAAATSTVLGLTPESSAISETAISMEETPFAVEAEVLAETATAAATPGVVAEQTELAIGTAAATPMGTDGTSAVTEPPMPQVTSVVEVDGTSTAPASDMPAVVLTSDSISTVTATVIDLQATASAEIAVATELATSRFPLEEAALTETKIVIQPMTATKLAEEVATEAAAETDTSGLVRTAVADASMTASATFTATATDTSRTQPVATASAKPPSEVTSPETRAEEVEPSASLRSTASQLEIETVPPSVQPVASATSVSDMTSPPVEPTGDDMTAVVAITATALPELTEIIGPTAEATDVVASKPTASRPTAERPLRAETGTPFVQPVASTTDVSSTTAPPIEATVDETTPATIELTTQMPELTESAVQIGTATARLIPSVVPETEEAEIAATAAFEVTIGGLKLPTTVAPMTPQGPERTDSAATAEERKTIEATMVVTIQATEVVEQPMTATRLAVTTSTATATEGATPTLEPEAATALLSTIVAEAEETPVDAATPDAGASLSPTVETVVRATLTTTPIANSAESTREVAPVELRDTLMADVFDRLNRELGRPPTRPIKPTADAAVETINGAPMLNLSETAAARTELPLTATTAGEAVASSTEGATPALEPEETTALLSTIVAEADETPVDAAAPDADASLSPTTETVVSATMTATPLSSPAEPTREVAPFELRDTLMADVFDRLNRRVESRATDATRPIKPTEDAAIETARAELPATATTTGETVATSTEGATPTLESEATTALLSTIVAEADETPVDAAAPDASVSLSPTIETVVSMTLTATPLGSPAELTREVASVELRDPLMADVFARLNRELGRRSTRPIKPTADAAIEPVNGTPMLNRTETAVARAELPPRATATGEIVATDPLSTLTLAATTVTELTRTLIEGEENLLDVTRLADTPQPATEEAEPSVVSPVLLTRATVTPTHSERELEPADSTDANVSAVLSTETPTLSDVPAAEDQPLDQATSTPKLTASLTPEQQVTVTAVGQVRTETSVTTRVPVASKTAEDAVEATATKSSGALATEALVLRVSMTPRESSIAETAAASAARTDLAATSSALPSAGAPAVSLIATSTETPLPVNESTTPATGTAVTAATEMPTSESTPTEVAGPAGTVTALATPSGSPSSTITYTATMTPIRLPRVIAFLIPTPTAFGFVDADLPPDCQVAESWLAYQVKEGDSLLAIALAIDSSLVALREGNCMNAVRGVFAGETLLVPRLPLTAVSTAVPVMPLDDGDYPIVGCESSFTRITEPMPMDTLQGIFAVKGRVRVNEGGRYQILVRPAWSDDYILYLENEELAPGVDLGVINAEIFGTGLHRLRLTVLDSDGEIVQDGVCDVPLVFTAP